MALILIMVFSVCSESLAPYRSSWDTWISRIGHIVVFLSILVAFIVSYVDDGESSRGSEKAYGRALLIVNLCWIVAVVAEGAATFCSGIPMPENLPRRGSVRGSSGFFSSHANETGSEDTENADRVVEKPRFRQGRTFPMPPQLHYVNGVDGSV